MTNTSDKFEGKKDRSKSAAILDLNGAEQRHNLKNQPGEQRDPDHAGKSEQANEEVAQAVKNAADNKDETKIAASLKKNI